MQLYYLNLVFHSIHQNSSIPIMWVVDKNYSHITISMTWVNMHGRPSACIWCMKKARVFVVRVRRGLLKILNKNGNGKPKDCLIPWVTRSANSIYVTATRDESFSLYLPISISIILVCFNLADVFAVTCRFQGRLSRILT